MKRPILIVTNILVLFLAACDIRVTIKKDQGSSSESSLPSIIGNTSGERFFDSREWIMTANGARIGISKDVLSDTKFLSNGARVKMEVGHE